MPSDEGARSRRADFPPTRKSLGQHFLTDRRILGRIADALHLQGDETVLEIGPGRGALTSPQRALNFSEALHQGGATICMVTHDPRYARHADRSVHLFDGKVVEERQLTAVS